MDNSVNTNIKNMFSDLFSRSRVPHAVLIEGGSKADRSTAAEYLAQWAVCRGDDPPCGECRDCIKCLAHSHPDIIIPQSSGKTNIVNIDSIRNIIMDASIISNEADTKVFIIHEADSRMTDISQNAFLKILEEPSQSTLFILTCESSSRMLSTVLSRVQVFTLSTKKTTDEHTAALAQDITDGLLSANESKLLFACAKLNSHDIFKDVLFVVSEQLRLGLSEAVGMKTDNQTATAFAGRITKSKIIALIELTSKAVLRADRNVNFTILTTWLCGEYRRILWQK